MRTFRIAIPLTGRTMCTKFTLERQWFEANDTNAAEFPTAERALALLEQVRRQRATSGGPPLAFAITSHEWQGEAPVAQWRALDRLRETALQTLLLELDPEFARRVS